MAGGELHSSLRRTSVHVPMVDGVRIAVDVWLPDPCVNRVGTVMRATRYWRSSVDAAEPSTEVAEAELFCSRGLALVTVDVRGTGASFGRWAGPWSSSEVADLGEVVDWIVAQPWSNGRVGAHGVSYDGNTAEVLAATGRPAVVAVAPRFADYDPWAHLAFPGGVMLEGFLEQWAAGNAALDRDDTSLIAGSPEEADELRAVYGHPRPVDGDDDRTLLAAAVAEHASNLDVFEVGQLIVSYDDDDSEALGYPSCAPFSRRQAVDALGVSVLGVASWFDAGTALGALARFRSSTGPQQVVIGAWSHGGQFGADPFFGHAAEPSEAEPPVEQQRIELADWLADRLADDGVDTPRLVRYYVCGDRQWRETDVWPPSNVAARRHYLSADGSLTTGVPAQGTRVFITDTASTTGPTNRWLTQMGGQPVAYPDRAAADAQLLEWTSEPLAATVRVVGSPVLSVDVACDRDDGLLLAYLEAVDQHGAVTMLTEGVLRLLHRAKGSAPYVVDGPYHPCVAGLAAPMPPGTPQRIELALLPIAAAVPAGSRLRLVVAGHDQGTFAQTPADGVATLTFHCGATATLDLPMLGEGNDR